MDSINIHLLKEILNHLEHYSEFQPTEDQTMESFLLWLNRQLITETYQKGYSDPHLPDNVHHNIQLDLDQKLSQVMFHLFRMMKIYIKKALENLDLTSTEDFYFLAMLSHRHSMKKSELVYENILEMPSGIEVIKRLLRHQLIIDYPDPDDKRSKRVKITKKGMNVVRHSMKNMSKASQIMFASLTNEQKLHLLTLIQPLYEHHLSLFKTDKDKTLKELFP